MHEPPLPANEPSRLAALRALSILDTPPEQEFDDLTALAAHVCGTPIALISLLDESRQWFKSAHGLDVRETSRTISFCGHAILTPDRTFVVPDALQDVRFADNPLVTGAPHIRGYAGAPLVDDAGRAFGTLCVIDSAPRTMTEAQLDALRRLARVAVSQLTLRRAALDLRDARERALEASRFKSEFLANMSHEVRTPLNGIIGLTTLLRETPLTTDQREYADGVAQSAQGLLALLNDVLDLSKVEAGRLHLESVPLAPLSILDDVRRIVAVKALAQRIAVHVECGPEVPRAIVGDPVRLRQVLLNLADNAVKFTNEGSVLLRALVPEASPGMIRFVVQDTGIGIPADRLACIFDKFTQADTTTTRRFGGTGLGLAICRELVELMGGTVAVTSVPGHGSSFTVDLPLQPAPDIVPDQSEPMTRTASAAVPRKVLLVEDNPVNCLVARRFLELEGCEVDIVGTGQDALSRAEATTYDVVLMDCQLPGMDGFTTTGLMRGLPGYDTRPIIGVTAHAMAGVREQCLAAGMSDYLTKPLERETLREALVRAAAGEFAPSVPPGYEPGPVMTPGAMPPFEVVLDRDGVRGLFEADEDAMAEFLALLSAGLTGHVRRLTAAHAAGDRLGVASAAHAIVGSTAQVGAEALAQYARGVELACRAPDAAIPDIRALQAAVATLVSSSVRWRQSLLLPITPSESR